MCAFRAACWLKKKGGTKMVKQCDLEAPAAHSNTFSDYKEMDYSDKIGTGTYPYWCNF